MPPNEVVDPKKAPVDVPAKFTAEEQSDMTTSVEIGRRTGAVEGEADTKNNDAVSREVDTQRPDSGVDDAHVKEPPEGEEAPEEEGAKETPEDTKLEDLGEWKPDDTDSREKFDKHYFKPDTGELNKDVLSAEFWANTAAKKPGLNEATYAYLKDTLGVSKEAVKDIEAGLVALQEQTSAKFFSNVPGGKAAFDAAVKWGREGGYTPAQRVRFNALMKTGGPDFEDAVEALLARHTKAVPSAAPRRGPPPQQKRSSPARSVSTQGGAGEGANGGGTGEFAAIQTVAAYQKAWSEGIAAQKGAKTAADLRKANEHLDKLQSHRRAVKLRSQ